MELAILLIAYFVIGAVISQLIADEDDQNYTFKQRLLAHTVITLLWLPILIAGIVGLMIAERDE